MTIPPEAVLYVGNEATLFDDDFIDENRAPIDVSTASALEMRFTHPDGTSVDVTPVFRPPPDGLGDGTDGKVRYTGAPGFLAAGGPGNWKRQSTATLAGGARFSGDVRTFEVKANLEAP